MWQRQWTREKTPRVNCNRKKLDLFTNTTCRVNSYNYRPAEAEDKIEDFVRVTPINFCGDSNYIQRSMHMVQLEKDKKAAYKSGTAKSGQSTGGVLQRNNFELMSYKLT
jgi:hypothetical protein